MYGLGILEDVILGHQSLMGNCKAAGKYYIASIGTCWTGVRGTHKDRISNTDRDWDCRTAF